MFAEKMFAGIIFLREPFYVGHKKELAKIEKKIEPAKLKCHTIGQSVLFSQERFQCLLGVLATKSN